MEKERIPLKTVDDLINAHETVLNKLNVGEIKEGTANAMTAQLKGVANLHKLRIDAGKLVLEAKRAGVELPQKLLLGAEK